MRHSIVARSVMAVPPYVADVMAIPASVERSKCTMTTASRFDPAAVWFTDSVVALTDESADVMALNAIATV